MDIVISLTEDQRERAEARAKALGYADSTAYLHALVEEALDDEDEEDEAALLASLERSLLQVQRGETLTVEEMWRLVEQDDND